MSLPSREAWIEIRLADALHVDEGSLPPREAWIEIFPSGLHTTPGWSLPPREAWIEIMATMKVKLASKVASPAGSVD